MTKLLAVFLILTTGIVALVSVSVKVDAQNKPKTETIQARAMGHVAPTGEMFHVTVTIESYSTVDDHKMLLDAFATGGHTALIKTLLKMKSRGSVAITGTPGCGIAYIRSVSTENGRTIRLMTDRPIKFAEGYANDGSMDYDISGMEISIAREQKASDGSLFIRGKFKYEKNQQFTFESYGSVPWKLVDVKESN